MGWLIRLAAVWTQHLTSRRYVRHFLTWCRACVTQVFEKSDRSRLEQSVQESTLLNLTVALIIGTNQPNLNTD